MIQIRNLNRNDAAWYRQLRLKALRSDPDAFLSTYETEARKELSDFDWEIRSMAQAPIFGYLGYFDDDQLKAYLQISKTGLIKQNHICLIHNLYVDADFRKLGIGRKLLTEVINRIKTQTPEIEKILLSHNGKNQIGHEFYQSLGFTTIATKKNVIKYQGIYDDEVEMELNLKN